MLNKINRYSEAILEEFRSNIQNKLDKSLSEQESMIDKKNNLFEARDSDWQDDTARNEVDLLESMIARNTQHICDLKNALVRIKNKSYGICKITGELIDYKRLLAVPTTSKSLAAKNAEQFTKKNILPIHTRLNNYGRRIIKHNFPPLAIALNKESKKEISNHSITGVEFLNADFSTAFDADVDADDLINYNGLSH